MAAAAVRTSAWNTGLLRRLETTLLTSTSRGRSARSPFDFGVTRANQFAPRQKVRPQSILARDVGFSIADARERIRDFLDGSYNPKRLRDLITYLTSRMLKLESRRGRDGNSANYIVDMVTKQSVPAAAVDARLSRPGIARKYGSSIEAEADRVRRQRSPEQQLAQTLRNDNAARLLTADADATPFHDWDDLSFSAPAMFRGREFSAQGKDIWVGVVFDRASDDPEVNLRLLAKARAEGKRLIIPALTKEDALQGRFTPGMPILLRDGAVRTRFIDPSLSYQKLTEKFGLSPHDHFEGMQRRYVSQSSEIEASRRGSSKVVQLEAFRQQFRRAAPAVVEHPKVAPVVVVSTKAYAIRHEVNELGQELLAVVDLETGATQPFDPMKLGAGRYQKEDGFGLPCGALVISADGGYSHFDVEDRYHNTMGPAIVQPQGSPNGNRYAINGEFVRPQNFIEERNRIYLDEVAAPQPPPAPAVDDENDREYRFQRRP